MDHVFQLEEFHHEIAQRVTPDARLAVDEVVRRLRPGAATDLAVSEVLVEPRDERA